MEKMRKIHFACKRTVLMWKHRPGDPDWICEELDGSPHKCPVAVSDMPSQSQAQKDLPVTLPVGPSDHAIDALTSAIAYHAKEVQKTRYTLNIIARTFDTYLGIKRGEDGLEHQDLDFDVNDAEPVQYPTDENEDRV